MLILKQLKINNLKIDTYTKTILTIIAICLTVNMLKDYKLFPSAYANKISEKSSILDIESSSVMEVRIVDISTSKELNVNLKNISTYRPLPVNLKKIETSDKLQTNITEVGGKWTPHGGPLPVKVALN